MSESRSYMIDGVWLDNPDLGWVLRGPSMPLPSLTVRRQVLELPGLPGVFDLDDDDLANLEAPSPTLMVETPRRNYGRLLSLLTSGRSLATTDMPYREARYRLLSTSYEGYGDADAILDVTATLQIPGVFYRDVDQTTTDATTLNNAVVTVEPWAMNGLVTDALVRVAGPVSGLRVESGNAYFEYASAIPAGSYLRYDCRTGRSYLTTTAAWSGGSNVSGSVTADGPGDKFAIFPARVDVYDQVARVTVKTTSRGSGAQIAIRGKAAYLA